jgi:hypothetical protein
MPTITERIQALEKFAEGVMLLAKELGLIPSIEQPPVRRKRRTKAEIAAAKGDGVTEPAFNPPPEPPVNRPIPRRTA